MPHIKELIPGEIVYLNKNFKVLWCMKKRNYIKVKINSCLVCIKVGIKITSTSVLLNMWYMPNTGEFVYSPYNYH